MRVIVIGAGEVGLNLVRTLSADGHDVTVVERDQAKCEAVGADLDALVVPGNGASPMVLRDLGIDQIDLLAAVTENDEANVIAVLAAKNLGAARTVARVRDPDFFGKHDSFARDVLGIDFVIDPDRAAASDISAAILLPGAVSVEYFGDRRLGLAEVIVTEDSPLVGVPLAARERPEPSYIVGIMRENDPHLATPDDVPVPGDHVLVVASRDHLRTAVKRMAGRTRAVKRCIIFGGGKIGLRLALNLERTIPEVTVVERDEGRARFIAEQLDRATVLHDEGISQDSQIASGVDRADAFVACAGDDRANLLAALNAKRLGAGLSVSVVSRDEYVPLVDALRIDAAFSPRLIAAEAILRFVHGHALKGMHLLRTGFEALELEAEPGAQIVGMSIGETHGLLSGCRVGGILRDDEVHIPHKGFRVETGDRVLMLSTDGRLEGVEAAFTGDSEG